MKIGIIGGGASGMLAAIAAAKVGAKVTIIEHMPRIGKKLLLTGSGKCNISNEDMDISHFHGNDLTLLKEVFKECPVDKTLSFLEELGLYLKNRNGYLYPYSEQASAVLDVLRFALRDLGVEIIPQIEISEIAKQKNFVVYTNEGQFNFDKLILCCGSKSYASTGSDGSGYTLAKKFGHNIIKPLSALTFLNCKENFYSSIAGIRTKANVSVIADNKMLADETGELQITKTGISGIPVFNISFLVAKSLDSGHRLKAIIDFLPDVSVNEIDQMLETRIKSFPNRTLEELFTGILHKNLGNLIIKRCDVKLSMKFNEIAKNKELLAKIIEMTKSFDTVIESTGGFDNSQVLSGGVDTTQVKSNLESKLVDGLYFAGEILDINGDCGGYNLTWAFTSGIVAGRNCVK